MLFELWCWRRLLRVPWTARRSNQSILKEIILKEISPGCSLEGLMLKLKLQYFGHLMWRADSFEKTLMLGKIEGDRRKGQQRMSGWMASPTQWTWVWVNSGSWWWTGRPDVLWFMGSQRVGHNWVTELNWTEQSISCEMPDWMTHKLESTLLVEISLCWQSHGLSSNDFSMVFPISFFLIVCESWSIMKAECQKPDAFKLWCWRRLLRVPWTARRTNQSVLKEINPEYSLEGLMLKLQYFGHLMWRADSLEKSLMLGKIEGMRRRGWQRMKWLYGITNSMEMCVVSRSVVSDSLDCSPPGFFVHGISQAWILEWVAMLSSRGSS